MRGRVAKNKKRVGVLVSEDFDLEVLLQRAAKIDQVAAVFDGFTEAGERAVVRIGLGDKGGVGEARRNAARDVGRSGALRDVFDAAVGQGDVNGFHSCANVALRSGGAKRLEYRQRKRGSRRVSSHSATDLKSGVPRSCAKALCCLHHSENNCISFVSLRAERRASMARFLSPKRARARAS